MGTKRYDVGGQPIGGRRTYPAGTILKLTDQEAKAMGLTSKDESKIRLTSDDATKADSYAEAMTRQDEMRSAETEVAETEPAADMPNKARRTR